jgi:hypothetical protein
MRTRHLRAVSLNHPLALWIIFLAGVWIAVLAFAVIRNTANAADGTNAIISIHDHPFLEPDGAACLIRIGRNEHNVARLVIIEQRTVARPGEPPIASVAELAANRRLLHLKSNITVATHYPADLVKSGMWIDGVKRSLIKPLTVFYVSDKRPATEIIIGPTQNDHFLEDARTMDGFAVISKWIQPRLPSPAGSAPVR